jgi:elongation factor Ts
MAKVDINLLKQLRAETNAPLKDCKEALIEAEGDIEKAKEILRQKGALKAAKKAGRETNEGIVKVRQEGDKVYGVKLACETDFVARNEMFHELAEKILDILQQKVEGPVSNISQLPQELVESEIQPLINEYIGKIGENIRLLDTFVEGGKVYVYRHPGDKVVAVVFYEGDDENTAKEVALQVAAMNPQYVSKEDVPVEEIEKMKETYREQLKDSGKPADIIERIVEGKINKDLSEIVLLEQPYIRDETKKIKEILPEGFKVNKFIRFAI